MPRNPSGTFTLAESPFVPSTPISSTAVNSDFSDIADGLTDSLSRSGDGGMTAELSMHVDGFSYGGDTDTGMRRTAANTQVIECGAVDVVTVTTTGASVAGNVAVAGNVSASQLLKQGGFDALLYGEIKIYAGVSAPAGYLLCNGQAVSRTTYSNLFSVIGDAYGVGDGSTTFNVPDLRGRVPAGMDAGIGRLTSATMTPDGNTRGGVGGAQTVTIAQANLPAATLTTTITDPGHGHTVNAVLDSLTQGGGAAVAFPRMNVGSGAALVVNNTTGITASTALGGSGTAVNKVQPTIIVNYIIYAGA